MPTKEQIDKSSTVNYTMAVQRTRARESIKQRLEDAGVQVPDFPIKGLG